MVVANFVDGGLVVMKDVVNGVGSGRMGVAKFGRGRGPANKNVFIVKILPGYVSSGIIPNIKTVAVILHYLLDNIE